MNYLPSVDDVDSVSVWFVYKNKHQRNLEIVDGSRNKTKQNKKKITRRKFSIQNGLYMDYETRMTNTMYFRDQLSSILMR